MRAWMQDNAIILKTLEPGSGFDDMQPLKTLIGDAGLVVLGEQRHVVRDFHRANHRMIEFLVSEMGFTVFAIEASFPGAHAINDYIIDGKGTAESALASLAYPAWTTETMSGMIEWMREYNATHAKKVKFYGVDNRPAETSAQAVWAYLRRTDGRGRPKTWPADRARESSRRWKRSRASLRIWEAASRLRGRGSRRSGV